tara:strand:- start:5394 stop:5624 length:231 start_codon:yes stop_codon:yes gene_type:complete
MYNEDGNFIKDEPHWTEISNATLIEHSPEDGLFEIDDNEYRIPWKMIDMGRFYPTVADTSTIYIKSTFVEKEEIEG